MSRPKKYNLKPRKPTNRKLYQFTYRKWQSIYARDELSEKWKKFNNFFHDIKPGEKGFWLIRLDKKMPYQPGNVKWIVKDWNIVMNSRTFQQWYMQKNKLCVEWQSFVVFYNSLGCCLENQTLKIENPYSCFWELNRV